MWALGMRQNTSISTKDHATQPPSENKLFLEARDFHRFLDYKHLLEMPKVKCSRGGMLISAMWRRCGNEVIIFEGSTPTVCPCTNAPHHKGCVKMEIPLN